MQLWKIQINVYKIYIFSKALLKSGQTNLALPVFAHNNKSLQEIAKIAVSKVRPTCPGHEKVRALRTYCPYVLDTAYITIQNVLCLDSRVISILK